MGLLEDVGDFITAPFRSAADIAGRLWHAVGGIFDLVKSVFIHVGDAWAFVVHVADHVWVVIEGIAESTYHAVTHIVTYVIPHAVIWGVTRAEHVAAVALHGVETVLSHVISVTRRFLVGAIHAVEHTLSRWVHFLLSRVNSILHWIESAAKKAVELVLHPERLVTWILPHLVIPLLRFTISGAKPIVKWLMQHAIGILHELAPELESVLKDLV